MFQTLQQRARLLRTAVGALMLLAAMCVVGLVFEWINLSQAITRHQWDLPVLRLALLGAANLGFAAFLAIGFMLYFWARMARSLPDLQGWHRETPESEFRASNVQDDFTFDDYLSLEDLLLHQHQLYQ